MGNQSCTGKQLNMSTDQPTFTITYVNAFAGLLTASLLLRVRSCRKYTIQNEPELQTAKSCVRDVFPDANITKNRTDKYPIEVIITAQKLDGNTVQIWSGRQQSLFRKNKSKRDEAVKVITANLNDLKQSESK
eukprot:scaffold143861_cov60-Attheya_sp.AAC.2